MTVSEALAELAVSVGAPVDTAGNRPVRLDDPSSCWFVESGALDVFLVERNDGGSSSSLRHLLRAGPGRLVFGVGSEAHPLAPIAKGLQGSRLRRLGVAELARPSVAEVVAAQADAWVADFAAPIARRIEPRPRFDGLIGWGEHLDSGTPLVLSARIGEVVWVSTARGGPVAYLGTEEPSAGGTGLVPVTSDTWLTLQGGARVSGASSADLGREGRLLAALSEFHALALDAEHLNRQLLLADEANLQTARAAHRLREEDSARHSLFNVLGSRRRRETDPPLMAALGLVGSHERITFRAPPPGGVPGSGGPSLRAVLDASGIRGRRVRLAPEDRWWRGDSGAMLGFRREDGGPVALLPGLAGRYRAVDPASGRTERLDAAGAAAIEDEAWLFYRSLPGDAPVGTRDVLRFLRAGSGADIGRLAAAGLLVAVLTLMPAVLVGLMVDRVIPAGDGSLLVRVTLVLGMLAAMAALLRVLQGTVMMQLEGRVATRLGAALWDRLLDLPPRFFRNYRAGDLGVRMSAVQTLRDQTSGVVVGTVLSVVLLLPALALLFAYDAALAWLNLGFGLLALFVIVSVGLLQVAPLRRRHAAVRRLSGDMFQFINGMGKLRAAGAEKSAMASWARGYREQQLAHLQARRLNQHLVAFSTAVPALASAVLFAAAAGSGVALGDFLAVYAASVVFYGAIVALGQSFSGIAAAVPTYEEIKPVLEAVPESAASGTASPELSGEMRLDHVSFRYDGAAPLILDDVSIHARPGEFVAIVGESGAGKSTLLRVALGLEEPTAGAVYYDGIDLASLERRSVRRQMGVVAQDGAIQPGNILDNILGLDDELTIADAWQAAERAAVDGDIADMPMQMFTVVGDSSAIFSGGQIQRIRIAAALARSPRIVFLDEATNWLDAGSQAEVMASIERLAVTRVVIAHRLSTVRAAERIYVLQAGRVVQEGSFEELSGARGPFLDLMQRQMA